MLPKYTVVSYCAQINSNLFYDYSISFRMVLRNIFSYRSEYYQNARNW